MASVLHRLGDMHNCRRRLDLASKGADRAGAAAMLEAKLLAARIATDEDRRGEAQRLFDEAADLLDHEELTAEDRACYHARLVGQRAYHLTKPARGDEEDLEGALSLFETIDEDPAIPFVCFRRNSGLAYCVWKLGDPGEGARLARRAAEFAGDGGFVRLRVMALNMLCRMIDPAEGRELNERAARLARQLEDEDLLRRVQHRGKSIGRESPGTSMT
jgi:hypothetical protein